MGEIAVHTSDIAQLVQLAVAPVFLLSGVGVTLGVLTNRLARIVDRARAAEKELAGETAAGGSMERHLRVLRLRARYINFAIASGTVSAVLVSLCVVLLFAHALMGVDLATAIAVVFIGAMLALTAGLVAFLIEVRISTATLRIGGQR
jgi:membrane associated rhomboid family serine protease